MTAFAKLSTSFLVGLVVVLWFSGSSAYELEPSLNRAMTHSPPYILGPGARIAPCLRALIRTPAPLGYQPLACARRAQPYGRRPSVS